MPMDLSRYPPDWPEISRRVRERAGNRCEGSPAYPDCRAANGKPHPVTGSKVVLTVAHLDHDPSSSDMGRLRCWCQKCHNSYDMPTRAKNRKRAKIRMLEEKGQLKICL